MEQFLHDFYKAISFGPNESFKSNAGYLVSSDYEKMYTRNGEPFVEYGTNDMILVFMGHGYKIASVVW